MDKITEQDLANRGVKGLPDVPGLTTEEMQRKLEEIAREILIPKVNELVEGLNNANSNLREKVSWANESLYAVDIFYGTGTLNVKGQQTVNDEGYYANLIRQATGWTMISAIIPVMNASIPIVMNVQNNIIYAYSIEASGTYDNVPFSYIAVGYK